MIMKKLILLATLCLAVSGNYVKKNPELRPECSYPMFKGRKSCKTDADCNMAWEYCDENCKKCRPRDDTY